MKLVRTKHRTGRLFGLLALLAGPVLQAQTAPATATPSKDAADNSEIMVLSPFEVNASDDNGYAAGGTLSGTRLRTDLRDVAASTQVVTKQFMEDIGATNLAELLVYTNGTEVSGLGGNMSSFDVGSTNIDVEQVNRQPGSIVRIRGIGSGTTGADQARDFFTTDIPSDGYNVDRVEINRGPNAMLFGLGSPSGIVNAQLIRAKMNRNATSVEVKFGRFGTYRGVLDHNQVLIKDKVAFRFAAVNGEQQYMQKPARDLHERFYGTLTAKPFKNTTIRVSAESAHRYANKPQNWAPVDQISSWFEMGKPTYDPTTQRMAFLGTPPPVLLANGTVNPLFPGSLATVNGVPNTWNGGKGSLLGGFTDAIYIINENPNVRSLGITGYKERGVIGYEFTNARVHLNVLTTPSTSNPLVSDGMSSPPNARTYLQRQMTGVTGAPNSTNWTPKTMLWNFIKTPRTLTDTSIYDFYTQLVEGPNKFENTRWKTYNAVLEQRLGAHAGVEFAVDKQSLDSIINNPTNQTINIDYNIKLPDGATNPNFGRPYVVSVGWAESQKREREGARVTAYYELDLRKNSRDWLGKLLGKHIVTGNITSSDYFIESFGGRPNYSGADYLDAEQASNAGTTTVLSRNFSGDKRAYWMMNYMGPSLAGATSAKNGGIQNTRVVTSLFNAPAGVLTRYYQSPLNGATTPAVWQDKTFSSLINTSAWSYRDGTGQYTMSRKSSESLSKVIILNSRLLEDNLITTLGWRTDNFKAFDSGAVNRTADDFALTDDQNWPLKQVVSTEVSTFNYGLVAHAPRFITERLPLGMNMSLTYNKSDNTSPASPVTGVDGKPIAAPTGSTKEFGGRLGFFDGKFELRVINYETKAANSVNSNLRGPQNNIQRHVHSTYLNIAQNFNNRIYSDPQPQDTSAPKTAGAIAAQKAWNDFWATPYGKNFLDTFLYKNVGLPTQTKDDRVDSVVSTSDLVAKGWDFEMIYNPTKNWRISANAAKASTIRSNTGAALSEFADQIGVLMQGPAGDLPQSNNSTTPIRDGFAQEIVDIKKEILLDGSRTPEERKWRYNVVTNYSFSDGRLKGLRVGGAVRWQDKVAIGYPVINLPSGKVTYNPLFDVKNPYFGAAETNYDAWIGYSRKLKHGIDWSVQLNVRNIGVGKELIPVAAQPDGSIAAYRTAEPMTWTISNKFDF